jgi:hypothetical protein
MTAPQQPPPAPEQGTLPPPAPEAQQTPSEAVPQGEVPWPPDPQTLIQLMMDARFSIIEESAGEGTQGADRQEPTPAGPPSPQPPAPPQAQG